MRIPSLTLLTLLFASPVDAAFFLDQPAMAGLLDDYEAYQERREIRYMAKASQFVGYVTGIVDALDGTRFCLSGGMDAERTTSIVAGYIREHPKDLPRHASETVVAALVSRFPCKP
jgi:hypothetical protein